MTWISRWKNISTKILQLQEVSRSYFDSINAFGVDHYGIGGSSIIPAARDIFNEVVELKRTYPMMPSSVLIMIGKLEKNFSGHHKFSGIPGVGGAMVHLGIFNSEMNFYFKDNEAMNKEKAKLALLHLQRTLIVDFDLRQKWLKAFSHGDEAISKLGALHLLAHGLWAFSVSKEREKRDLILNTPIIADEVQAVGACLVLTEWRKITPENVAEKARQVLSEARKCGENHVPGSELKKEKYLVMVSERHVNVPTAVQDDDTRYIFVNISLTPPTVDFEEALPMMSWVDGSV